MNKWILGSLVAGGSATAGAVPFGVAYSKSSNSSEDGRKQFNEAAQRVNKIVSDTTYKIERLDDLIKDFVVACKQLGSSNANKQTGVYMHIQYECNRAKSEANFDFSTFKLNMDKLTYHGASGNPNYMTKDVYCKEYSYSSNCR